MRFFAVLKCTVIYLHIIQFGEMKMRRLALLITLLVSTSVQAAIYKCTDDKGARTYSDIPCSPTAEKVHTGYTATPSPQKQPPEMQGDLRVDAELKRLTAQEERIFAAREARGSRLTSKIRVNAENDELDSIRRQKRALLGKGGTNDNQDARLRKLERDSQKPLVEDFRMNGRQCQKASGEIRCN